MRKTTFIQVMMACCVSIFTSQTSFSSDFSGVISEEFLRTEFIIKTDDKLKYSHCKEKNTTSCSYVWGVESSKDIARINAGLSPKGYKLLVVYVRAKQKKDFQRVTSSYSDAVFVEGLGEEAVWSAKRKQLSLITVDNQIIHVNVSAANIDSKEVASNIAREVLANLTL